MRGEEEDDVEEVGAKALLAIQKDKSGSVNTYWITVKVDLEGHISHVGMRWMALVYKHNLLLVLKHSRVWVGGGGIMLFGSLTFLLTAGSEARKYSY